jgi:hypothetical protein
MRLEPFPFRLNRNGAPDPDQFEALTFVPAPELETWPRPTFIEQGTPLQHDRGRAPGSPVFGRAEGGEPAVNGEWARARAELQITPLSGMILDFILTFEATCVATCSDAWWLSGLADGTTTSVHASGAVRQPVFAA